MLIVGTGLTGSLTCYHLRQRCGPNLVIDVADMARGAGGRMSTTRWGADEIRANTGAQYISCCTAETQDLLESVCASNGSHECLIDQVDAPLKRSTHFVLQPDDAYTHWLPRSGTNSVVKQFLHAGAPNQLAFESRLQRVTALNEHQLFAQFDRGGKDRSYDAIVLAMPPKDILRFFNNNSSQDSQSQADLHRRTNKSNKSNVLPQGHRHIALPPDVLRKLREPAYNGRYSLATWFHDDQFINALRAGWDSLQEPHAVIDMISPQQGVLVTQSTVELWKRVSGGGGKRGGKGKGKGKGKGQSHRNSSAASSQGSQGGGRDAARSQIVAALEEIAGRTMPRAQHAKLLNWRTSQAAPPLVQDRPVVTANSGQLIFTGDWCVESSFEGCNLAAQAAATAAADSIAGVVAASETVSNDTGVTSGNFGNHTVEQLHTDGSVQPKPNRSRNRKSKINRVQRYQANLEMRRTP